MSLSKPATGRQNSNGQARARVGPLGPPFPPTPWGRGTGRESSREGRRLPLWLQPAGSSRARFRCTEVVPGPKSKAKQGRGGCGCSAGLPRGRPLPAPVSVHGPARCCCRPGLGRRSRLSAPGLLLLPLPSSLCPEEPKRTQHHVQPPAKTCEGSQKVRGEKIAS